MNNGEGKESGLKALKPVPASLVCSSTLSTLSLSPVNTSHITSRFSSLGIFLISVSVPLCPSPPLLCLLHPVPQLTKLFLLLYSDLTTVLQKRKFGTLCTNVFFFFFPRKVFQNTLKSMAADKNAITFNGRKAWDSGCSLWLEKLITWTICIDSENCWFWVRLPSAGRQK